jgi:hypothetical protein
MRMALPAAAAAEVYAALDAAAAQPRLQQAGDSARGAGGSPCYEQMALVGLHNACVQGCVI